MLVALSLAGASLVWLLGVRAIGDRADEISAATIREATMDALRAHARSTSRMLADRLVNLVYFYDLYAIDAELRPLVMEPDVLFVTVFDAAGRVIHDASPRFDRFDEAMGDPFAGWALGAREPALAESASVLHAAAPLLLDGEQIGGVRIGFELAGLQGLVERAADEIVAAQSAEVSRRVVQILAIMAALFAAGVALAFLTARSMLAPVDRLSRLAEQIEAGDYDVSLVTERRDEIGELMRTFHRMGESVRRNTMEIRHLAYHDSLTGLPNRRMFRQALEEKAAEVREGTADKLALLFIDLDDFKRFNDTLGHDEGDRVLVAFAGRVKRCLGRLLEELGDEAPWTLLARLGGDEFTVTIVGPNAVPAAERLADALIRKVAEPISIATRSLHVGTSIGLTVCPDDATSSHALLKNADVAMYRAKTLGKHRYQRFDRGLVKDSSRRLDLEGRLRRAVDEERIRVVFQPIVRVPGASIWGAEALARIDAPGFDRIPPAVFIPIAEETGLIDAIGEQVLRLACRAASDWQAVAPTVVTVNLSAKQIGAGARIVEAVGAALAEVTLPPEYLVLEITESSLLATDREVIRTIEALRHIGAQVWLDDFGTGFSGLSHLRRLPVDGVKIDRSFISDILLDPDDLALASAIVGLARSLSMGVIAEGVESEGQLDLLTARDCRLAQGFLFGRPMDPASFAARLVGAEPLRRLG